MMTDDLPLWRSMLFVPGNVERFVNRAHERGADAIILDLEDSVPLAEKPVAREQLLEAAGQVSRKGADVVVRINSSLRLAALDLETSIDTAVNAICVPKVASAGQLTWISDAIGELELERQIPIGHTRLIALIESTNALTKLESIARSSPRLTALILGSEDFSASAGMEPTADALLYPNQQVIFAATSAGILPLGFVGSISHYDDLDAFRETIRRSRRLGLQGGFCIHPDQVQIMNEEFSPSEIEVSDAKSLLAVYERGLQEGLGTAVFKGRMIDAAVVNRAVRLLAVNKKVAAKNS